ncbi:thioredoxin family protein [Luteimonas sp BLCC-B24]|uniref:thioredoxin family protein n=1 Tax=Luteimonas sp. BLCC-B24 TaxID=3025317 RepID=UPI00234E2BAA|nr:thioredoxin family protein [Luteimonas sp. BLCC-B24]MDC7808375.1 thioredoxin family protein [Luteimonas sp. BLCC-B24]
MTRVDPYSKQAPDRVEVDAMPGIVALEFGTDWCGFCQAAQAVLQPALAARADVRHLRIEDGPGRPLGRSFKVKLWPTLVVLRDGVEVSRRVRPGSREEVEAALEAAGPGMP